MKTLVTIFYLLLSSQIIADNITWILPPEYDTIMEFHDGISAVKQNGRWGYLNSAGHLIVPCEHEVVFPFSDGMGVIASTDNTLIGIVDTLGNIISIPSGLKIDSRFAEFSDGLLLVTDGLNWGYLGKSGEMSIPCKYISALPFSEGLAGVLLDSFWYYISPNGDTMIPTRFQGKIKKIKWALGFKNGKALIVYGINTGYIDRFGRPLKDKSPKLLPPSNPVYYKRSLLACRNGNLIFDSKGCAVAYTDKDQNRHDLIENRSVLKPNITIPGIKSENVSWLSNDMAVCKIDGKSGIVKIVQETPIKFSVDSLDVNTYFGLPTTRKCTITKGNNLKCDNIVIKQDSVEISQCSFRDETEATCSLSLNKSTDSLSEKKVITISAWQYGVKLCDSVISFNLKDVPSITISYITKSVTINPNDKNYSIRVTFENIADFAADSVKIKVNKHSSIVSFKASGKVNQYYSIPVSLSIIPVEIQQGSSIITMSHEVKFQTKTNQKSPDNKKTNDDGVGSKTETNN